MRLFTLDELEARIRELAMERPDFKYTEQEGASGQEGCSYVAASVGSDGGEGCIVGQAMMRLGVPEDLLREVEHERGDPLGVSDLMTENSIARYFFSPDAYEFWPVLNWISWVQSAQDQGFFWADAVEYADSKMKKAVLS